MSSSSKRNTLLWFSLSACSILALIIHALKGHLLPIITAIVLVYLTKPLQQLMKSAGFPDKTSAVIISLSLFSIVFFIIFYGLPLLVTELSRLILQLPKSVETTYSLLNQFLAPYDITLETHNLPKVLSQSLNIQDIKSLQHIPSILSSTISRFIDIVLFFTSLLFIPLFFFFTLQHSEDIQQTIISTIPPNIRADVSDFLAIVNETLTSWIAGQGGTIICLSILYVLSLLIIGTPYAVTLGITTGLLYIIPVVGPFIAVILTSTITIASSGLDMLMLGQVLGLYTVLGLAESLILSPYFVGNRLGLNLPLLLFSILMGGGLFGGIGIILSVPTASILKKTFSMIDKKNSADWLYD